MSLKYKIKAKIQHSNTLETQKRKFDLPAETNTNVVMTIAKQIRNARFMAILIMS